MEFDEITAGLEKLLKANHYNPATIRFYKNEWKKIKLFLSEKYSDSAFDMERGLAYLEEKYHLQTKYNDGTLSQQRVQLLRVVHMLEDYRLHKALTRRFHASKNPIQLNALLFQNLQSGITRLPQRYFWITLVSVWLLRLKI